ncbi:CMRF35-like molecule 8 isoform X2 [Salmo salar]|uniref:CMRF35-like molecule 8 n=1 Tax=Salmo salar TaxID=8030 RepID=B5X8Q0_SALSA|nr:CMRF35-like molecule 8 precursor [Salmo salar]XP_045560286.1 CMRF35-like molecule 8 isoform X2 [Salmo salar]ACI67220.1 CMRF35-like molecule 8 precursor [Salmo salar]|eukprot:NP_001134362.1 CMRF35-like molecule 8 precursor [Salmo salar]
MTTKIWINLIILCLLTASSLSGPSEVKSAVGETVHISCQYHQFNRDKVKFWCRGYHWYFCTVIIRSDHPKYLTSDVQILDDKNLGLFTVSMKGATAEDSGWYWCAIERASRTLAFRLQLTVSEWLVPRLKPETTEQYNETSTSPTTLPHLETTTRSTPCMTQTTSLISATSNSTSVTVSLDQDDLVWKVWRVLRWMLFLFLCLFLVLFSIQCHR